MLAARAEGRASPLQTVLPVEAGAMAMQAWQQSVRERGAQTAVEYQRELWLLVLKMGLQVGCVALVLCGTGVVWRWCCFRKVRGEKGA